MRLLLLLFVPVICFSQQPAYDSLVKDIAPRINTAGASVFIAQKGKILLDKGYGYAHLGFKVPATPETKYFMIAPGTLMLATAVMQQVEKRNLSLDDNINKYLPEFPSQGKKITIRHLLSSTSGIPDMHYLGDPFNSLRNVPRATDEVIDMFAGLPLTMEPGTKFDWSISNYALLSRILEIITGQFFKDYATENILSPLGMKNTEYLEPYKSITNVAEPYSVLNGELYRTNESLMKYDPSLRFVTTASDVFRLWRGLADARIINAESFRLMTAEEEMKKNNSGNFGYGIQLVKDSLTHFLTRSGALDGYSNYMYYDPGQDLTIIVLSNTVNQSAREIGRRLAALAMKKPVPAIAPRQKRELVMLPMTAGEMKELTGTYVMGLQRNENRALTFNLYKRTLRVFQDNGILMVQYFGELPVPLRKQQNGSFLPEGQGSPFTFNKEGETMRLTINGGADAIFSSLRTGKGDARTFRQTALKNILRD